MKSLLLPLVACAALAGCADYGTVAYGSYPTYPYGASAYSAPVYPYGGAYPYGAYGYGYGWSDPGWAYGYPTLGLAINQGRLRGGHRDWHDGDGHWQHGNDLDARGGNHRGGMMAGVAPRGPATNAMGAGPAGARRGPGGGRRMVGHNHGARAGGDAGDRHR